MYTSDEKNKRNLLDNIQFIDNKTLIKVVKVMSYDTSRVREIGCETKCNSHILKTNAKFKYNVIL